MMGRKPGRHCTGAAIVIFAFWFCSAVVLLIEYNTSKASQDLSCQADENVSNGQPNEIRGVAKNAGSRPYGPAGGRTDLLFGKLPTMSPSMITEPNRSQATYLAYHCGMKDPKFEEDAIDGHVSPNTHPWVVSIAILNPSDRLFNMSLKEIARRNKLIRENFTKIDSVLSVCGGVLIASSWVLTAHHCLSEHRFLKVAMCGWDGSKEVSGARDFVKEFDQIHFHPGYKDATNKHDIAIVKLKEQFQFDFDTMPVCLPHRNVIPRTDRRCVYFGWSTASSGKKKTGFPDRHGDTRLRQFRAIIDDPNLCQERYKRLEYDVNFNVCNKPTEGLGEGNIDSATLNCKGYSGGPLTCEENDRWVVYGIINWGEQSCDESAGRGHALVSTRIKWICCTAEINVGACQGIVCS